MELVSLLLVLVLLNIYATYICVTRIYSEPSQIVSQVVIVWLLPLIGSIGLLVFHRTESNTDSKREEFGGGEQESMDVWRGHGSSDSSEN